MPAARCNHCHSPRYPTMEKLHITSLCDERKASCRSATEVLPQASVHQSRSWTILPLLLFLALAACTQKPTALEQQLLSQLHVQNDILYQQFIRRCISLLAAQNEQTIMGNQCIESDRVQLNLLQSSIGKPDSTSLMDSTFSIRAFAATTFHSLFGPSPAPKGRWFH
jgi:hypothetical protein